jgi:hypothetical protein
MSLGSFAERNLSLFELFDCSFAKRGERNFMYCTSYSCFASLSAPSLFALPFLFSRSSSSSSSSSLLIEARQSNEDNNGTPSYLSTSYSLSLSLLLFISCTYPFTLLSLPIPPPLALPTTAIERGHTHYTHSLSSLFITNFRAFFSKSSLSLALLLSF